MMQNRMNDDIGLVLVHGAGLGSWIWSETEKYLQTESLAVDFPGRDRSAVSKSCSLDYYCEYLSEQITAWGKTRHVIVAHSIGGVISMKLADQLGERLAGFIGVSSSIPKNGGSFISALPLAKRLLLSTLLRIAGTRPPKSAIIGSLCNGLSADQAEHVADNFVSESIRLYTDRCDVPSPDTRKLYIKCSNDLEFPESLQNAMIKNLNAQQVTTIDSGHLPMLSCPKELAEIIDRFVAALLSSENPIKNG